jgi:hypothetical protein
MHLQEKVQISSSESQSNDFTVVLGFKAFLCKISVLLFLRTGCPQKRMSCISFPRLIKALELVCTAMAQGGNVVSALGSTQQYSRRKYMPLKHVS